MRILHTSDWHLGRSFHREDLLGHQGAFVDHLLEVVAAEGVDVVVVSGDVYDRALPHVDAVALADEAFARLAASRARVVVSSGNHDSARRLGFGSRLMDAAGVFVRTDASSVGTPVVLADQHGDVAIHAIPYLDPSALLEPWALGRRSHEAALSEAMTRVRSDLGARPASTRSVVLAHAFVAGATPSESERDISVGGVSRVATSLFDDIDYTALGHLHGPHVLDERLRYSGSPLAYSFSEADQAKGSWIVDLDATGFASATWVDAPVPRRLARLSGTLDELLGDPTLTTHEDDWVQVTLTDVRRPLRAMELLRRASPTRWSCSSRPRRSTPGPLPGPRPARATTPSRSTSCATCAGPTPRPVRPPCSARPSTPAATTPTRTCSSELPRLCSPHGRCSVRLHQLQVVGFGPFADPVSIDFDALSDAGLFLLSGPTGAGKSSVLDAVCFALYGDVPGDRAVAKRLRSDHAADDVAPRVVLEATLSGRRFRIDRSPAWTRPKKRGTGTTTEQARVVISERRPADDGQHLWHPLSTRLDETGHLVTRLVGMTLPQFCQVAMLPQGRFQAFLRARSEERHALLQQVFRTERFDRAERWLLDRRVELRRRSQTLHDRCAGVLNRFQEAAGVGVPEEWDAQDLDRGAPS